MADHEVQPSLTRSQSRTSCYPTRTDFGSLSAFELPSEYTRTSPEPGVTAPVDSPAPDSPPATGADQLTPRVYLLDQIARGPAAGASGGNLNKKIPAAVRRSLELTNPAANRVRDELAADGLLRKAKAGRTTTFALTDDGRAFLDHHRAKLPPPKGFKSPSNDRVIEFRTIYLLLRTLAAESETEPDRSTRAAANKFEKSWVDTLELNVATADYLRIGLCGRGFLTMTKAGPTPEFALTPSGRSELGSWGFDKLAEFELKFTGKTLNALLEAAREVGKQDLAAEPAAAPPALRPTATPDDIDRAIAAAFNDLLREEFAVSGMVPIHRVRAVIRDSLGDAAARHDAFDPAVLRLWQVGELRLFPITDLSKASPDELRDSIPGTGETLFYLEAVRDPVAAG